MSHYPWQGFSDSTLETWLQEGKEYVTPSRTPSPQAIQGPVTVAWHHTRPEPGRRDRQWHGLKNVDSDIGSQWEYPQESVGAVCAPNTWLLVLGPWNPT